MNDADARYDKNAVKAVMATVQDTFPPTSHAYNYYLARGYEILSRATDAVTNTRTRANEKLAIKSLYYIEKALLMNPQHADSYRIYSEMLGRRIYGASTGMKYDAISLAALDKALSIDPKNHRALLRKAVNCLQRPVRYGGNPDEALRILTRLNKTYPQNSRVIYYVGDYYRRVGNLALYRASLKQAVAINPQEWPAIRELEEQQLQKRRIRIHAIDVRNKLNTSELLIKRRLSPFVGQIFTLESKTQIETALTSIPPIDGVSFNYTLNKEGLDIELQIDEDNMRVFNLALGLNLSLDAERNVNWFFGDAPSAVFGLFYFETNNFLGTGDTFSLASAAVYNDMRYQHFTRGLDSRFFLTFNVFPLEKTWYHNGERTGPEPYQYIWVKGEVGLGKSFEMADVFLMQSIKKDVVVKTHDYFKKPAESVTMSTYLHASFGSIAYLDTFWLMDGIKLELTPEMIFKPGYARWGYTDQPLNHNGRPMFKLAGRLGMYKTIFKTISLREDIFYLYCANPFLLEQFAVGKDAVIDPFSMKLRGFYQEEFVTRHGIVANTFVSFPLFTKNMRMGLFYDFAVLFETPQQRKNQTKYGAGMQLLFKLPWHLEFVAQGAIGINAHRKRGPGIEMDFYISRLFVR
ncbi:MAG: hypothetical protein JXR76_02750 [Deltaproteobacteria bacterium]|nr:hypothetical protein [Deltaproteobacteria bacterium]